MIVDPTEDLGRVGFSGLLSQSEREREARATMATEAAGSWEPLGLSHGGSRPHNRAAVAAFNRWLDQEREAARS